jgi:hypothetical protein
MGAVTEALTLRTPVILLPPANSTQLHHYGEMTGFGLTGLLGQDYYRSRLMQLMLLPWPSQTVGLLNLLSQDAGKICEEALWILEKYLGEAKQAPDERYIDLCEAFCQADGFFEPADALTNALRKLNQQGEAASFTSLH